MRDDRCTATTRDGEPCGNRPMLGSTVCRMHGGAAPQVRASARRRLAEREALASLADQRVAPIGDPLQAFADITAEAVALKEFLAGKVAELTDLALTNTHDSEALRAVVAAYERAMDRAGRFLAEWVRLGLDERRVALTERQGALVADVLAAVIAGLLSTLREALTAGETVDRAWVAATERDVVPALVTRELNRASALLAANGSEHP